MSNRNIKEEAISFSLEVGKINTLEIYKNSDFGLFLRAEDGEEVLLPNQYIEDDMKLGNIIDVFLYHDSEDRIVATTLKPTALLDEYALFKVVDLNRYGAFVDWGLPKDLFVPVSQQKEPFRVGDEKILKVCKDKRTGRLYATQKIGKSFSKYMKGLKPSQEVDLLILAKTPLGYKVIVNNLYEGMIFDNEIFQPLEIGEKLKGYIKKVREDRKLDISLRPIGKEDKLEEAKSKIVEVLKDNEGILDFNYKSSPDEVKAKFNLSRKLYKKALSSLIQESKVKIEDENIHLISSI